MLFKKKNTRKDKRKVYGFLCDPGISNGVTAAAGKLGLPDYAIGEHSLDLGLRQVMSDLQDEETKLDLEEHLIENHFLKAFLHVDNRYDNETAIRIRKWQLRRWEFDKVAHRLVGMVVKEGIPPELIIKTVSLLIKEARKATGSHEQNRGGNDYGEQ